MKNDYTRIAKPAEPVNGQDERATEVLLILAAAGGLAWVFRKYGRR